MPRSTASRPSLRPATSRRLAVVLGAMLALPVGSVSREVLASTPSNPETNANVDAEDPGLAHARTLYEQGHARFETFDYEGAVTLWTEAYAEVPEEADWIRNRMVYNIATAQQRAYDVDEDVGHLRQAALLLEQYVVDYRAMHEDGPKTQGEVDKARERITELRERIERTDRTLNRDSSSALDGIVWRPTGATLDPARLERNQRLSQADRKTDRILVASTVTLSLGGLLTLVGAGTAVGTRNADAGAQGAGYGTLGLGLAGVTAGATLLAVGLSRRRKARRGTLVEAAPAVGSRYAGATVSMRF